MRAGSRGGHPTRGTEGARDRTVARCGARAGTDMLPRMRIALPWVASAALLALSSSPAAAAPPLDATTRDFDQIHVAVRVTPHLESKTVDGETTIRFASIVVSLTTLRLHCEETDVMGVSSESGAPLVFKHEGALLSITLEPALPRGK